MTTKEAYVLGWVYGRLYQALGRKGVDPAADVLQPCAANGKIITLAKKNDILEGDLELEIGAAISQVATVEMPMENGSEQPQAAEHQSSWWIGYYRALNGVPFAQNEVDIRAMRKARKMTQVDLAAKLGVAQAAISRWESGEVTPTSDSLHKILRAFSDCSVSD